MKESDLLIAAEMAGAWWAERLNDKYADRRDALSAAIARRVDEELTGVAYWCLDGVRRDGRHPHGECVLDCDYQPKGLLASAVAEVFDDMPPWELFTSTQDLFPRKHLLRVEHDSLHPKEGYKRWSDEIKVR